MLTYAVRQLSEVPGVAAWALGMLCSHNEAAKETMVLGGVESLVQVLLKAAYTSSLRPHTLVA